MNLFFLRAEQIIGLTTVFILRAQRVKNDFWPTQKLTLFRHLFHSYSFFARFMFHCSNQLREQEQRIRLKKERGIFTANKKIETTYGFRSN